MPDTKISTKEAIMLIISIIIAHTIVTLPATLLKNSKSGILVNIVYVSILALLFAFILYRLFKNFQSQDIFDISDYLGGPFLKNLIGIIFIIYFISSSGILLRNFAEGLKVIYFPNTNILFIILSFIITICITNSLSFRSNIKVISIILPFVIVSIFFLFIGNLPSFSFERVLPILGEGFFNTFVVGTGNIIAFSGISCLYIIPPLLKKPEDFKKIALTGIAISALYLILCVSTLLFMFSFFLKVDEILPLYTAASYIEYGSFFQRLDSIFLLIWMLEICCYLTITSKFSSIIFKKITNLKYQKPLTFVFPLLIFSVALLPKTVAISKLLGNILYRFISLSVVFCLGFVILLLANIKKLHYNRKHKEGNQ